MAITSDRDFRIVNLRVLATFIVVFGHCIILYDPQWSSANGFAPAYSSDSLYAVKKAINFFQMELFFMISGYCFKFSINSSVRLFMKKKGLRLLIPFVCIGLFYMIPLRLCFNFPAYEGKSFVSIMYDFFTIHDACHLWFLPVLFFVMCIAFIVDKIVKKNRALLFAIVIVSGLLYAFAFYVRTPIIRLTLLHYPFFLLGEIINTYSTPLKNKHLRWNIVIACIVFFVLAITVLPMENHFISLLSKVSLVYIIFWSIPARQSKLMNYFDKNSFGIYLLHSPLLLFGLTHFSNYPPHIYIILQLTIVTALSILIILVIRRAGIRWIIGETNKQ